MVMKRCDNGHFFDDNQHSSCPHCGVQGLDMGATVPIDKFAPTDDRNTGDDLPTQRKGGNGKSGQGVRDEGATVALVRKKSGIDPVVGWFVCVEGADKGRDFRIRSERNFIGRSSSMDVAITGDNTISKENHAVVSFNPRKGSFFLSPGDGRGLIYLNDDEVAVPTELNAYDQIELGETKLVFVPLCGDKFSWNQ